MNSELTELRTGVRSYQLLTVIGSLLTIWDLIVHAVLSVGIFAIIAAFRLENKPKLIGYGLTTLIASYFLYQVGLAYLI